MTYLFTIIFTLLFFLRPFEAFEPLRSVPVLFVVGLLAGVSLAMDVMSGRVKLFYNGTDQMMLGFYLAIAMSHVAHFYFGGAVVSLQSFFPVFIGYFLTAHSVNTPRRLNLFIAVLIFCAAFIAFEGILEVRDGASMFGVTPIEQKMGFDEEGGRIVIHRIKWLGPFSDPNDLAMLFVVALPFLLDYLFKRIILVPGCLMILILYGLYLTNSRGGVLSLLTATLAYLTLRYRSAKGVVLGGVACAVLLLFGPSRIAEMSASESSAYGRLEAWYSGYQMFKSSPLFGVGKGMYTDFNRLTAHNSFVLIFAELGIFGVIFFVGQFFFPLMNGYLTKFSGREPAADPALDGTHSAMLSALLGLMVSMFFLSRSYELLPYMMSGLLGYFLNPMNRRPGFANILEERGFYANMKRIANIAVVGIVMVNVMIKVLL